LREVYLSFCVRVFLKEAKVNGKTTRLKVLICSTEIDTYYLPVEAKKYKPNYVTGEWSDRDSIEADISDKECKPAKEDGDDWQIVTVEEAK
jgi:hypothetical protein